MKFYRLGEVPILPGDQVFKTSALGKGIATFFFLGVAAACAFFALANGRSLELSAKIFLYWIAVFLALFGWLAFRQLQAVLKSSNWLVRCNPQGLIIKYRSYLNWRLPSEDVQAIGLDYSEIASVGKIQERQTTSGPGGEKNASTLQFIDFCLVNPDTSALEDALQAEQQVRPNGVWITLEYPVEVQPGGIIRISWKSTRPSARRAIQYLGQFVSVAGSEKENKDLSHQPGATPTEEDAKILALAKSGDEMAAIVLARQIYGASLTEARAYVERLRSGK